MNAILCLTKYHSMKVYGGVEVWVRTLLNSAIDGGEWSVSPPERFIPRERAPGAQLDSRLGRPSESVWMRRGREKNPFAPVGD